jgi:hypothetical protein
MMLALPFESHIWMNKEEEAWQIKASPQQCTNVAPGTQICSHPMQPATSNPFSPTGSNIHLEIPAVEFPWNEKAKRKNQEMYGQTLVTGSEIITVPDQQVTLEVECDHNTVNEPSVTVNANEMIAAKVPQACGLKMKNVAGKVLKQVLTGVIGSSFISDGPPGVLSFQDGTLQKTSEIVAHQLSDVLAIELHTRWPYYLGLVGAVTAVIWVTCFILPACTTMAQRHPEATRDPRTPRPKNIRQKKLIDPLYVRLPSPGRNARQNM